MVMGIHQKNLRVKVVHGEKKLRTTQFAMSVSIKSERRRQTVVDL
jgi:hypothetical protein